MSEEKATTAHDWQCVAAPYKRRRDGRQTYRDWLCRACGAFLTLRADLTPQPAPCEPPPEVPHKHCWRDVGMHTITRDGREWEVWDISCLICYEARRLVLEKGRMAALRRAAFARACGKRPLVAEAVAAPVLEEAA